MAVLFAVGAVSGTILSFEMGMLWPGLMGPYGDVIGLPFALEGIFFFIEAIFIGIYLYGWNRLSARLHLMTLIPIALSRAHRFVLHPHRKLVDERASGIRHLSRRHDHGRQSVGGDVQLGCACLGAYGPRRLHDGRVPHRLRVRGALAQRRPICRHTSRVPDPFTVAAIAAPVQVFVGDIAARALVERQPAKFAAMELLTETETRAPFTVGGVLIDGEVVGAIKIPLLGSFLATRDLNGEVPGLDAVPDGDIPPVNVVHIAFQVMVAIGTFLVVLAGWFGWSWFRRRGPPESKLFWIGAASAGVLATIAVEAGWTITEVGRQP